MKHWIQCLQQWTQLKMRNLILNHRNYELKGENTLLKEQNEAYSIENFNAGRAINKLLFERNSALEMVRLNRRPNQSKGEIEREIQEVLTFMPYS